MADIITYSDAIEHLRDASGGATVTVEANRAARRAILQAYDEIATMRAWRYYNKKHWINVNAAYSTGTVEYDLTGGSVERELELTIGTWPAWAGSGTVRIDSVNYPVLRRISDTIIQLDATLYPLADIAAGTSYVLYQSIYALPDDYLQMSPPIGEASHFWSCYVSPEDWQYDERVNASGGSMVAWTVMNDPRNVGRKAVFMYPYPDASETREFIYRRKARALRYSGFATGETSTKSGTASCAASTTLTGSGTAYASGMAGSMFRIRSDTTAPEGLSGSSPYAEQAIIESVTGATTATLKTALTGTYSAKGYTISDPIDVGPGMVNLFLALCELYYLRLGKNDTRQAEMNVARELSTAQGSESDHKGFRSAWGTSRPYRNIFRGAMGADA